MSRFRQGIGAALAAVLMATLVACGSEGDDPVIEAPATSGGGQPAGSSGYDYPG